jgi:isoleucyl-tRNA synthetase
MALKKYTEYKEQNYPKLAEQVLAHWKKQNVFQETIKNRQSAPNFTFYEGPPSANGTPGIHHVISRTVKDIFCRYKTMQGYKVERKGGWDTHGLPVELQVEKELGITKDDIGKKISVAEYNARCKEAVMKYKGQWDDLTQKMGYWVDLGDPYITFNKEYIESLWSILKSLFEKDLLYQGFTIQPYSPAAGTGLSSHELNQPGCYRDVKDTSIVAQFKVKNSENDYLLAWTTTPWTLPANSALAIGQNITYVKVATYNSYTFKRINVILAKELVEKYFNPKGLDIELKDYNPGDKDIPYRIIEEIRGSDLIGLAYEQLLPYVPLPSPAFTVVPGDFVTTEEGTGIVHISKTFGADDYRVSVENNIPGVFVKDESGNEVPIVDKQGRFVSEITDFAGRFVKQEYEDPETLKKADYKSTDVRIAIKLKEENKAFKVEKYVHSYPHCWRTDKPILYYPLNSWFIRTTAFKDRLIAKNETINWKPQSTGKGRFGNWLENLVDWNLSRSRFWGTPLPIWVSDDGTEMKCIGSFDELMSEVEKAITAGFMEEPITAHFDPHRPYVDDIFLVSDSGQKMSRVPDLVDVWFDSGAMPYAQWHLPFENNDRFENSFPADFIAEGVDQTRGWFFTLHALAVILHDSVAFKNVIANGLVLDKNGNKMSKRLGNAVDPFETLKKYGPDATRWYMIANANPWDNLKFNVDSIGEVQRRFFNTLFNTYSFFSLYANLDGFDHKSEQTAIESRVESDRWIISKLNTLIKEVKAAYDDYEPTRAARLIQQFATEDLSNWYVRLNRKRFWLGELNEDKRAAYHTLHECLKIIAQLSAPIAPFYMDRLYEDLTQLDHSVHLTDFPSAVGDKIDTELEHKMFLAQEISSLVHSIRKKHNIRVRQPLHKILLPVLSAKDRHQVEEVQELILSETNVKAIEFVESTSGILKRKLKPNFQLLGKRLGPKMKVFMKEINGLDQEIIGAFENSGTLEIELEGQQESFTKETIEIVSEDIPGWAVASEKGITVALDITIDEDLQKEGIARDLVNRVQNLRKDSGLEVQDKIEIWVSSEKEIVDEAVDEYKEYIKRETQSLIIHKEEVIEATTVELDNMKVKLHVTKN